MRPFKATALVIVVPFVALQAQTRAIRADSIKTFVSAEAGYSNFGGSIDPWRLASLSVGRNAPAGSLIGRLNYANRFSVSGAQWEADAYPRFGPKTYAYLNAGYSSSASFPSWRFGGEINRSLPREWEASIGFRELRFPNNPVTLFTGAVGKYFDNYWISARPYLRFRSAGNEASAGITARRYFVDADHYVGIRASYGTAPSDAVTPDQLARTRSYSADVHGSGGPWKRAVATWSLGFAHEGLSAARTRKSWTLTAGMKLGL